jgi:hypothetical protein
MSRDIGADLLSACLNDKTATKHCLAIIKHVVHV